MTSCAVRVNEAVPTTAALPSTATLPPSMTAAPSDTPLPPPPPPTVAPVEGTTSTQINVRSEPSTAGNLLGILPPNTSVLIVGKDPGGNWWQILYDQGTDGKGWVTAQYVTATNPDAIPVVGGSSVDPNSGTVAIVQQQINVRSGPGTSFNALGTLNAQDVVSLTGKDSNGAWLQITYTAGPDGKGWVNAAFVQARGVENLPIITEAGQVVGTGTPTGIPLTPTPTIIPAWDDHDSQNNPLANVVFEPNGTRAFIYAGDVSSPQGDTEDWIQFKPDQQTILASITCTGSESLQVELLENGIPVDLEIGCGAQVKRILVKPNFTYLLHVSAASSTENLQYIHYTIKLETSS